MDNVKKTALTSACQSFLEGISYSNERFEPFEVDQETTISRMDVNISLINRARRYEHKF